METMPAVLAHLDEATHRRLNAIRASHGMTWAELIVKSGERLGFASDVTSQS
jgi:hypothetical protein